MNKPKYEYPVYIFARDITVRVEGEFDSSSEITKDEEKSFIDGKGYLDLKDDCVWIYKKMKPMDANRHSYFWVVDNKVVKSNPSPEIRRYFLSKNIQILSKDKIIETCKENPNSTTIDESILNDMMASSELFHPVMYAKDDFLKKIVKTVLNELCIPMSKYKSKVDKKYMLSNMKSALVSPTKMSTPYFNGWVEMLKLKVTIIVESEDDAEDKLEEPFVYVGERDTVYRLSELGNIGFQFPEIPEQTEDTLLDDED